MGRVRGGVRQRAGPVIAESEPADQCRSVTFFEEIAVDAGIQTRLTHPRDIARFGRVQFMIEELGRHRSLYNGRLAPSTAPGMGMSAIGTRIARNSVTPAPSSPA